MIKHRCRELPNGVNVEWDREWQWSITTTREVIDAVKYCAFCGVELYPPKVTALKFKVNMKDAMGDTVFTKGQSYAVIEERSLSYDISDDDGGISTILKKDCGKIYEVVL